ncbi:MAG TPA: hypothetical protein O0X25_02375 [Methanocorpusculum sp.]|nr:hypothetical protein [Methanocorpusculum sp.]HJJ39962.1 hypothetical protein [Methanocorpusculum sp.]HJJ49446.1 hypothetical protein [Methanocorpusculum sp.]HJJ56997.1 hypothetical protein [Methanocorpusculum sp.]
MMSADAVQSPVTDFLAQEEAPRFVYLKTYYIPEIGFVVPYLAVKAGDSFVPMTMPADPFNTPAKKDDKTFWSFRNFLPTALAAQYETAERAGIKGCTFRKSIESGSVIRKLMKYLRTRMDLKGTELTWNIKEFTKPVKRRKRSSK